MEVQSAFFDQNQVTIHPMMFYYKKEYNGQQRKVKHAIIGISDDLRHDTCLVRKFETKAAAVLNKELKIDRTIEWTDGCAAQYKAKAAFADISLQESSLERNFFETSHGKNVCDGLRAVVKNVCYQAVLSGKAVLGTAADVFSYCTINLTQKEKDVTKSDQTEISIRDFIFVSESETNHQRAELQVQTVPGTRKLHAVRNDPGQRYALMTRNLSCFCDGCRNGQTCTNSEYVSPWLLCKLKKQSASNDMPAQQEASPMCILMLTVVFK